MTHKISCSGLVVLAALGILSLPARADLLFSLESPITAMAGDVGDSFDVLLTNTGSSAVTVADFSFGITTTDTDITFTGATTSTVTEPYIFAGDSFDDDNGFPFYTVPPPIGQTLEATDASNSGLGDAIGAGDTVAVGNIIFDVANGAAPGPAVVTFEAFPTTGLLDPDFNYLSFTANDGSITVTSTSSVPEPATIFTTGAALAFGCLGFAFAIRRRRATLSWRQSERP